MDLLYIYMQKTYLSGYYLVYIKSNLIMVIKRIMVIKMNEIIFKGTEI